MRSGTRRGQIVVLAVALAVIAALLVIATRAGPDQQNSSVGISVTTTTVTVTATAPGATTPRTTPSTTTPRSTSATTPGSGGTTDPTSGLPWVAESRLPPEAAETLALIRAGGPFPYPRNDDKTFRNDEDVLPKQRNGYYREYTVRTPGSSDRGARRIVTGAADEKYWTDDHYASFSRIREGS